MDQVEEVFLKTVVTIQPIAPHVEFVGLSFSPAPSAIFFTSLLIIQNTAPLNDNQTAGGGQKLSGWRGSSAGRKNMRCMIPGG